MRILVLGGDGMLGHQLLRELGRTHDVTVSLRNTREHYRAYQLFDERTTVYGIDAHDHAGLAGLIGSAKPDIVVNAIGIVKQRDDAKAAIPSLEINALLPHRLADMCAARGARLIHISTDCVFSGSRGAYREEDFPDADDLYGRSKLLGEVTAPGCLTLRTSIIGLELKNKTSLIEWYLAQTGTIRGFTRAIYSGLTTYEFSRVIGRVISDFPGLDGLYQVASDPISKYEILQKLTQLLDRKDVSVSADDTFHLDRSLNGEKFARATSYCAPSWDSMLGELSQKIRERQVE
jgi:dTDP-4-dehydrorhamnose reductase